MRKNYFISVLIIALFSCYNGKSSIDEEKWSAFNLLSIPYEIRKAEFDKANKAPNLSFERGNIKVKILC